MRESTKSFWSKVFAGSGWALATMFVWELCEEGLEELIAYAITSAAALFITKALSTFAIVTVTQGIKVSLKRLLLPFVKTLTYREGCDKMNLLKRYFRRVWGNKITGTLAGIGFGGIAFFQTLIPFATGCWWIAAIVFVVFFNVGIYFGGETLNQIKDRLADALLKKQEREKLKEIEKKAKELAKKQHTELFERAKELVEQEKLEKANENK